MAIVKIVTDSTADIPKHILEELDISVVPLKVHFGEETFLDGVTLAANEFYKKLSETEKLPTTSQPSPMDFVNTYKQIQNEATDKVQIISIHISSALSGTAQSALLAQSMLTEEIDVTVIDSKNASYGIGMTVVKLAQAAKAGKTKEECIALGEELVRHSGTFFLVNTLEYLHKGGRIGRAAALFGTLLNIKPILSLNEEGEVYPIDKVRGNKKAVQRLLQVVKDFAGGQNVDLAVAQADAIEEAEQLKQQLITEFEVDTVLITDIGSTVGTHAGPKTLGIIAQKMEYDIDNK